jgi:RNA polymerase sigma-B factor
MATELRPDRQRLSWDRDETRELLRRYREEGDVEARNQLVTSHLNLVRYLASKFCKRGEPMEDLVQVGTIGLIKAIDRFEPERGLEFTTYATPTILGEIKRHFRDKGWSVRVPRKLQELSSRINQEVDMLTQELQHTPTVDELADYLGVSVDDVLEAMESADAYSATPIDAAGPDDEDTPLTLLDRIGLDDEDLERSDARMLVDRALAHLRPREREIVMLNLVEGVSQAEIARRFGTTTAYVSGLIKETTVRVRKLLS